MRSKALCVTFTFKYSRFASTFAGIDLEDIAELFFPCKSSKKALE